MPKVTDDKICAEAYISKNKNDIKHLQTVHLYSSGKSYLFSKKWQIDHAKMGRLRVVESRQSYPFGYYLDQSQQNFHHCAIILGLYFHHIYEVEN